ncbi:12000_t:CDS:2 [Gigaspora margarita]|uniref:12000_t:CDS:1 n=1 Tax=Gigaspora margarita TaxID=4874 RepID=A0ABN7VJP6_GIGMA|nr:12000_t:CDS:2 [Gigaspora margarita]
MLPFKRTYESTMDPEDIRDIEEIGSNQHFCSQQFQPRDFLQLQQQIFFNSHLYTQDDLSIINDFELYSQIQHPTSISVNVLDPTSSTNNDDKSSLTSEEFQRLKKIDIKSASSLNSLINPTFLNHYYLIDLILKVNKNMNKNMNTNSTFLSQDVISSKLTTYCIKDTTNDTPTFSPSGLSINPPLNDLCKNFIEHYFTKLNPIIPIIDPKRFSDQCERKKTKHFELLKLLDTMYDTPRLETIQSLLLLSMSELIPSRFDNGYMFLGMAVQMAHLLRIDVIDNSLDPAENEERQRIYYCLYIRDKWHSFALAKPPSLDYVPNRVPLPKLISFSQLVKDHFIAFVELSHIVRRIWTFGYSPSSKISYEDWHHHLANPLSDLMKIRSELANWLKKLPNTLQYLYLPATDLRSFLNILFHTCIMLTHKFYIPQTHTAQNLKSLQHSPIQICLNSAIAIIDIAKTTREFDADAFYHFTYVAYAVLQATTVQLVIMNISKEYESIVKLSLENSIKELKLISKRCAIRVLADAANELENIVKVINELKSSTEISQLSEFQDDHNNEAEVSS